MPDGCDHETPDRQMPSDEPLALTLRVIGGLDEVERSAWDAVANPPDAPFNPFVSWDFLEALEASGCVAPQTGWAPRHLIAEDDSGRVLGAVPAYLKCHSQGEYVFDHGWANAFERAGGTYYPKLQCAVPFTPVTGPRMLSPAPQVRAALRSGLIEVVRQLDVSSLHVTFPHEEEWVSAGAENFLQRTDQQFIWTNRGYATFDDFLADLASRKRKAVRKERAAAQDGVVIEQLTGDAITGDHMDAFFAFYLDTGARKWGEPYLNRLFFELLRERMTDRLVLILASRDGAPIAGALNLMGSDALYGRYWGRVEDKPFLHFELCYYQAIDVAIARGLARVEAGAQGAHKVARGYAPSPVYSYHWIANPGFRDAISQYLDEEREAVAEDIQALREHTPFKRGDPAVDS